jgi:hypothetical protein
MNGFESKEKMAASGLRWLMWAAVIGAILMAIACGGDSAAPNTGPKYPTGIGNDIAKQLKFDGRVQDFEESGNTLVVNVNDSWAASPPGMRERALGQWFSLWQAAHGKESKIVVKHGGDEVDTYTADKGYQPVSKETKKESEG